MPPLLAATADAFGRRGAGPEAPEKLTMGACGAASYVLGRSGGEAASWGCGR